MNRRGRRNSWRDVLEKARGMQSSAQNPSLNEPPTFLFLGLLLTVFPPQGMLSFIVAHLMPALKSSAKCYLPLKGSPHHPRTGSFSLSSSSCLPDFCFYPELLCYRPF